MGLVTPRSTIIEQTALKFATIWYEAGRSTGMTSKHKTARHWAAHNFQKFIPKAVEHLIDSLNSRNVAPEVKHEIYSALMERIHDKDNNALFDNRLPNIDLTKVIDCKPEPSIIVNTKRFEHANEGDTAALMKGNSNG